MAAEKRQSLGAAAVVCRQSGLQLVWLARWNKNWQCYYLVGGHKHEGESFRECLTREIREELGLEEGKECVISPRPCRRLEYDQWSESARAETHYCIELFAVKLGADTEVTLPKSRREVRWLSREEIQSRRCVDGQPVSPTMERMVAAVNWTCPWASFASE